MKLTRLLTRVVGSVFLLLSATNTQAAVVLSNLGATVSGIACGPSSSTRAESFTTGPDGPYSLQSVTYTLEDAGGTLSVSLYNDNNGEPNSKLSDFASQSIGSTGGANNYTFTPSNSISLASSTTYWLVASSTACSKDLAAIGDEPTGIFDYGNSVVATAYDIASGTYTWGSTSQSAIFEVVVDGGSFEVTTSASSAQQIKNFTYSFCYENSNPSAANVQIDANIPTGTTYVSATGSYSVTPSTITWSIGGVAANSARACVDMVVNVTANPGDTLTENATITSDQTFLPRQRSVVTSVVEPTSSNGGGGGGGGGLSGGGALTLLEFLALLTFLQFAGLCGRRQDTGG